MCEYLILTLTWRSIGWMVGGLILAFLLPFIEESFSWRQGIVKSSKVLFQRARFIWWYMAENKWSCKTSSWFFVKLFQEYMLKSDQKFKPIFSFWLELNDRFKSYTCHFFCSWTPISWRDHLIVFILRYDVVFSATKTNPPFLLYFFSTSLFF